MAEIIGIDCDGFDVRVGADILRFDFEAPVADAAEARARIESLL